MADKFVRVRLLRITGADLNLFEFDWDLTWACFFMNAEGKIYGRYGGRDASGPDSRNSLAGLRYAMQAALAAYGRDPAAQPNTRPAEPLLIEMLPSARFYRNGCIHCHQVKEILREEKKRTGTWSRDDLWTYPLPDNVGITLEIDRGNVVKAVAANSPAQQAGLRPGDLLKTFNGYPINSFADAQYALHKAPKRGEIAITWLRGGASLSGTLELAEGWRRTNITWRPSLLDLLPSLPLFGSDLSSKERKLHAIDGKRLAYRLEAPVHSQARAAGLQEGDVIFGLNGRMLEMTGEEFLGHIRRNHLIGDRITLNVLRAGKRLDVPLTLR